MSNPAFTLLLQPKFTSLLADGTPNVGGSVYTYQAGTVTPLTTYSDSALTAENTNPIVLDANGQCDLWIAGPYKVIVQDANGVQLYAVDNLFGFAADITASLPSQSNDMYLVWDNVTRAFKNSTLTRSAVETAVNAFNVALLTNGAVVVADVGDTSPGTLTDKLTVTGNLIKTVNTDGSGNKTVNVDCPPSTGSDLYLADNYNTLGGW